MDMSVNRAAINLEGGALLQIRNSTGSRIECLAGGVWITQEKDTRDIILQPGETFLIDREGLTLVGAFDTATISIIEPEQAVLRDGYFAELRPSPLTPG